MDDAALTTSPRASAPFVTMTVEGETFGWQDRSNPGDGLTLLIHAGVFSAWFEPLAARLPGRVLHLRRAGYLDDSPVLHPIAVAAHAAHAVALLDAVRAPADPPATVVAHSSGCAIGLQLASGRPDLVGRLILSEPPLIPALTGDDIVDASGAEIGKAVMAAQGGDGPAAFDIFLRAVCGPSYRAVLRDALGADGLGRAERESVSFFASELPGLAQWQPADLSALRAPVTFVQGSESPDATHRMIARLAASLPVAEAETIAGAGHLLPLTHPDELARVVSTSIRA